MVCGCLPICSRFFATRRWFFRLGCFFYCCPLCPCEPASLASSRARNRCMWTSLRYVDFSALSSAFVTSASSLLIVFALRCFVSYSRSPSPGFDVFGCLHCYFCASSHSHVKSTRALLVFALWAFCSALHRLTAFCRFLGLRGGVSPSISALLFWIICCFKSLRFRSTCLVFRRLLFRLSNFQRLVSRPPAFRLSAQTAFSYLRFCC